MVLVRVFLVRLGHRYYVLSLFIVVFCKHVILDISETRTEMREPIPDNLRRRVFRRDGKKCRYCGKTDRAFHVDHVYPVVKGGETTLENLVVACKGCNLRKHSKVGIWPKPVGYFDTSNLMAMGGREIIEDGVHDMEVESYMYANLLGSLLIFVGIWVSIFGDNSSASFIISISAGIMLYSHINKLIVYIYRRRLYKALNMIGATNDSR